MSKNGERNKLYRMYRKIDNITEYIVGLLVGEEKEYAEILIKSYLKEFTINTVADKETLRDLIYLEIIGKRLREQIDREKDNLIKTNIDNLYRNTQEITKLKQTLGLLSDKRNENESVYKVIETLKKKHKAWMENNQASRKIQCKHCNQYNLLVMRTDAWEAKKHPYFKDKTLYNKHAFRLLKQGKLRKMDVALILDEDAKSTDYVDWILKKVDNSIGTANEKD